ncbi:unnamed protein product [Candidula unifasciata]|uniref:Calcium uniporter protein n=1 Tax=Candidula unifasciata TaxID=100452 RepID=A0A8S3Z250_9EUPU|nr:unnamed protein product [Candidula unifasciata]
MTASAFPLRKLLCGRFCIRKSELFSSCSFSLQRHQRKVIIINVCPKQSYTRLFSSQPFSKTDVTVFHREGLPVIALTLPSKQATCEFLLKPLTQNVGDLARFIKEEDGGIDTVSFFTKDGSRIAKSTSIDVLLRSEFDIDINGHNYHVSPPALTPVSSEDALNMTDVKLLVSQLYSTIHLENYQLEKEKELQKMLEDLKTQIAPLEEKTQQLSGKADVTTNRLLWLGMGAMGFQFGILARLTWWDYSWDVMEPITYFVTYGTSLAMFAYFLLTKQEYVYPNVRDRQFLMHFYKLAQKEKFDVDRYNQLLEDIAEIESDLQRLRHPLKLHLPIREIEKVSKKE